MEVGVLVTHEEISYKTHMTHLQFLLEYFERYDIPDLPLNDCSSVHGAKYCIKHIGRFEGLKIIFSII